MTPWVPPRFMCALALTVLLAACGDGRPVVAPGQTSPAQLSAQQTPLPSQAPGATTGVATQTPASSPNYLPLVTVAPTQAPGDPPPATACVPTDLALQPILVAPAAPAAPQLGPAPIPVYRYTVIHSYPHDEGAFTQGLVYDRGVLYEGTGLNGQSTLRRVSLETGAILTICTLPSPLFGEGITIYGDKIYQLTWQSHIGFVYARDSFALLQTFSYPTEGWGLTHDGARLIMSDGTATLHFLDPNTLEEIGYIDVLDDQGPVIHLNELEYVRGEIYANVWQTDRIARIDPATGQVRGWIDLSGLLPAERQKPGGVLNGIAYDAEHDRLFVTGKWWPTLFEIALIAPT